MNPATLFASMFLVLGVTVGAPSVAQSYYILKPIVKVAGAVAPAPAPTIALSEGVLPEGKTGKAYSFDLKTLTAITGEGEDWSVVTFALGGGTLPTGLSLSSDGVLGGTPMAKTADEGADYTVVGTYKTATGQRVYRLKVGQATLEATAIAPGNYHTCAITTAGAVKCWGKGADGQLGNGTTANSATPVNVTGLSTGIASISAGANHTCAVTMSGSAVCWGLNSSGPLGDGTTTTRTIPVNVSGLSTGIASISAGANHTCAATTGGAAKCWGQNSSGQLGDGTWTDRSTPANVTGLSAGVASISAGQFHTCAVSNSGAVKCWGRNTYGQLGDGSTTSGASPVNVAGLSAGVASISAEGSHTCAVTTSGSAMCWGLNSSGELGNGTQTSSSTPVSVTGLTSGVASISSGNSNTCAVTTGGAAKCWGYNYYGQLGDGTAADRSTPVNVTGLSSGVASIWAAASHTCAVTAGGAVKCWGQNTSGQLGSGTTTTSPVPVSVID